MSSRTGRVHTVGPTTVIYIAGYGRSGSTLLDLLLGRLDGFFSMGEFRLFWHAVRDDYLCACGVPVARCDVWSKVLALSAPVEAADVIAAVRDLARVRRVPGLVAPRLVGTRRDAWDRLAATLGRVYDATAETTGARVLVDSSKDPLYGLVLRGAPDIRLHVVHLVRDPRAVAWSWQRKRRRPEIGSKEAFQPVYSTRHTAFEWDLRNTLAHRLARRADSATRITYEALVADPMTALDTITRSALGAPAASLGARDVLDAPAGSTNHTVAGNPMRFTSHLELRPDVEWEDALAARDRRAVTAFTLPLLLRYGYPLRVRNPS